MQTATIDATKKWTVEDYLQLEEGLLAQLIDGQLIKSPAPSPLHQRTVRKLYDLLKEDSMGEFFFSPVDLYLDSKTVLQPDLVFVSNQQSEIISGRGIEGIPDMVIEVISPSNSFIDRNTKKRLYLEKQVKEYWIVDPANRTLEIYSSNLENPQLYLAGSGLVKSNILQNAKFDLSKLFD